MVVWMHLKTPKAIGQKDFLNYIKTNSSTTELSIMTMAPIGNGRVTRTTLGELRPAIRRFGLVNYVRDTTKENAERKWYHFRAVGKFKIFEGLSPDAKSQNRWIWYLIQPGWDKKSGGGSAKTPGAIPAPNLAPKTPASDKTRAQRKPLNVFKVKTDTEEAGKPKAIKKR